MAVLARKFQKQEDFFNKACKRSLNSLFSYAFVFLVCNSTENVLKTIYTAKIVGYRQVIYRGIFWFDAAGLAVTQIWPQNALFSKFQFNSLNCPKPLLKVSEVQCPCGKIAHTPVQIGLQATLRKENMLYQFLKLASDIGKFLA